MRLEVEVTVRQTVEVEATDEDIERYGVQAMGEELGAMAFDPDAADWDYYATETGEP